MGQFIENMQYKIKTTSSGMMLFAVRIFVGFVVGLTFALIGERMIGYGTFSFLLMIVSLLIIFQRISREWKWSQVGVFSLTCVLLAMLLKMYILVAPGA